MAKAPTDYHRGEMDIQEQTATYSAVMAMTKWGSLALTSVLLFVILWFCTGTGFLGSASTGASFNAWLCGTAVRIDEGEHAQRAA